MVAIGAAIIIGVVQELNSTLDKSVGIFYRLAAKGFGNKFDLKKGGVVGDFYRGLFSMDVSLSLDIANGKRINEEALRINSALDNVHSSVMVADNNFDIIYLNTSAKMLFKEIEPAVRTRFSNFSVDKILGTNMDIFHTNPKNTRDLLNNLTTFCSSDMEIGGHFINVVANPVIDKTGNRIGFVAEWVDNTAEIKATQEISNIVQAASKGDFELRIYEAGRTGFILDLIDNRIDR
jgi:methyl-accepting chemotaxis protein